MSCGHVGYREPRSQYDASTELLVFSWTCEDCGERLGEVARLPYRPDFRPDGNQQATKS
jgi:hypothetical protein